MRLCARMCTLHAYEALREELFRVEGRRSDDVIAVLLVGRWACDDRAWPQGGPMHGCVIGVATGWSCHMHAGYTWPQGGCGIGWSAWLQGGRVSVCWLHHRPRGHVSVCWLHGCRGAAGIAVSAFLEQQSMPSLARGHPGVSGVEGCMYERRQAGEAVGGSVVLW